MNPLIVQNVSEILDNSTPEQKVLWQQIRLITGENAAVRQFHYQGPVAGDIATYSANRLYLIYKAVFGPVNTVSLALLPVQIYNENNALVINVSNYNGLWNTTAAVSNYIVNSVALDCFYFSRIVVSVQYVNCILTGFQLNY